LDPGSPGQVASHTPFGQKSLPGFPCVRFAGCHWSYAEPDVIQMEIDEWLVVLKGHNLEPLFRAINEQKIVTIEARPECEGDPKHAADTFVTRVQFAKLAALPSPQSQQPSGQMRLGIY
jgi:hypothetical protein